MGKGSRRGGGGGGGRGRGAVSENDVQRVAATITDLATQLGFQVTDVGTRAPTPTPTPPRHSGRGFAGRGGGGGGRERGPVSADGVERVGITPLAFAAAHGQVIAARYFLDKGANPNKKNSSRGTTLLHEAAEAGFHSKASLDSPVHQSSATQMAIKLDPADAVLYSNRSLCHLKCGEAHDALLDADACISLRPEWHKGYYRKGAALMLLLDYKEASDAFLAGVKLDPKNKEMKKAFWEAVEAMRKEHSEPSLYTVD
ncbi:hypothetical protein ACQ4PT_030827 [Festuca glaucescens]